MLDLNLQFFADDTSDNSQNTDNENNGDQSSTNSSQNENMIPYSRFKELNENFKATKSQLDQLVKDKELADEESKKKQGEFESLYTDLKSKHDPLSEELKKYQESFQAIYKNKLAEVPEKFQGLIPNGTELEKLSWIENAIQTGLFGQKNSTQTVGDMTNGDVSNNEITKDQFNKMSYEEKDKLFRENPNLYRKLRG